MDNAGEHRLPVNGELPNRKVQRETGAVFSKPGDLTAHPNYPGYAGRQIVI